MPRSSSISSTRPRLSGKLEKHNDTACAMIAGGNRWRLKLTEQRSHIADRQGLLSRRS